MMTTPRTRYQARELAAVLASQGRKSVWVADRIGMSESLFCHVMAGRRTVTRDMAMQIADILDVPIWSLFAIRVPAIAEPAETEEVA